MTKDLENPFLNILRRAEENHWCVEPYCTTCGNMDLRSALYDIGGVLGGPLADALSEINIDELTSFPKWEVVLEVALMDIPLQVTPLLESWLPHADKNTCFFEFVLFKIVPHLKKDNPVRRQWINKSKGLI